jgi:hypothetical protein
MIPGCNALDYPDSYECTETIPAVPAARRVFRGIELLARKSVGKDFWVQASYLFSSLRGNYEGGVTADGQTDPGVTAAFEYPWMYHNSYGRMSLDRPHSFRLDAYYTTPWKLLAGLQGFIQSGAPLRRLGYGNEFYGAAVHLVRNGTAGRLPSLWGVDLLLAYPLLRVGPATVTGQMYVFNLFDNQIETSRDEVWSETQPAGYPASIFDPNQPQTNPNYGKATGRQEPRLVRGAIKIAF